MGRAGLFVPLVFTSLSSSVKWGRRMLGRSQEINGKRYTVWHKGDPRKGSHYCYKLNFVKITELTLMLVLKEIGHRKIIQIFSC